MTALSIVTTAPGDLAAPQRRYSIARTLALPAYWRGAATASGYSGAATASGYSGAATASGYSGRARGAKGCALFLVYRDPSNRAIKHAWAGIVGESGIKPDHWYRLDENGQPADLGKEPT